jgi:uncharacterized protein involved in exopolysaccharide biosynthesis
LDRLRRAWADTLRSTASEGDLTDQEQAARLRDQVVATTRARVRANLARPAALSLRFVSEDPVLAAAGADALADLYLEDRRAAWQRARQREHARLEQEIDRLAARIDDTAKAIEELRATTVAGSDHPSEEDLLDRTGELAFWRGERAKIEARLGSLQSRGTGAFLDQAALRLDWTPLHELQAREAELEREIAELSQGSREGAPELSALRAELASLEDQKRFEVEQAAGQMEKEVEIIRSRETALEAQIGRIQEQLAQSGGADGRATLERRLEADRALMRTYRDRATQLEALQTAQTSDARIVNAAVVPTRPAYPRQALIYVSALGGGLLLGGLLALALEALQRARA